MEKKAKVLVGIAATVLLICVIFPGYGTVVGGTVGRIEGISPYQKGWYVEEDGVWTEIELPFHRLVSANQEITFVHKITKAEWGKWLYLSTRNKLFSVYADGRLIYRRETYATPKNRHAPTNGYNYIEIPEGTETISFVFSSPYANSAGNLNSVYIGDSEAHMVYLNYTLYEFHRFMDTLLMFAGGFGILYGVYLLLSREKGGTIFNMGLLVFALGIWLCFGTTNIENRHLTVAAEVVISYAACLLIPVFLCSFMSCYFENQKKKYLLMAAGFALNMAVDFGLVFAGAFDFVETMLVTYGLLALAAMVIAHDMGVHFRQGRMQGRGMGLTGFVILCVSAAVDFLVYCFTMIPSGAVVRFGIVCCVCFVGVEELHHREQEKLELYQNLAENREKQLHITSSQLQPHFIFNALGAIRQMIRSDSDVAYDMLYDFSRFLRVSYRDLQEEMIPFTQELEQIQAYLNIEEKRFSHRIRGIYEIGVDSFLIPALTVEPLVMNAVQHGLRKGRGIGTVTVRTYRQGDNIVIEVEDDGIGFDINIISCGQAENEDSRDGDDSDPESGFYMSLPGICSRLKKLAGAAVTVESEIGKGTKIRIELEETSTAV